MSNVVSRRRFILGTAATAALCTPSIVGATTMDMGNYDPKLISRYHDFDPTKMGYDFFTRPQKGILRSNLLIVFDKSSSVEHYEYIKQTKGTAAALRSDFVKSAILNSYGENGQRGIGFSLSEFDNGFDTRIPWAILETEDDIENMAKLIEFMPAHYERGGTGIFNALHSVVTRFRNSHLVAYKQVMDISGDGPENQIAQNKKVAAHSVKNAAQMCFQNKIRCNGLAITSPDFNPLDFAPTIADYYSQFVKTPDGFVIGINKWSDFRDAMEVKLELEIAGKAPSNHPRFHIA